jgi:CAAX prenyl protease-like protein
MAIERALAIPAQIAYPVRFILSWAVFFIFSRRYVSLRPAYPLASIGIGILVFIIWVAPDLLFNYRHSLIFENSITGTAVSSISPDLRKVLWFVTLRGVSSTLLVPIVEELFWRGWLMRWLIHTNFLSIPLGQYQRGAFWISAVLFASEHGPYWEVGLLAGIIYNWWIIRTRNLADCILAHAVTNGILCGYVLVTGRWEYWL